MGNSPDRPLANLTPREISDQMFFSGANTFFGAAGIKIGLAGLSVALWRTFHPEPNLPPEVILTFIASSAGSIAIGIYAFREGLSSHGQASSERTIRELVLGGVLQSGQEPPPLGDGSTRPSSLMKRVLSAPNRIRS